MYICSCLMNYTLLIDTSASESIVCLTQNAKIIAHTGNNDSFSQASAINGMIDNVVVQAGITLTDVGVVAVCSGPGSYTGLRVAMATAKGICYATGAQLIMHHKLELMCWQSLKENPLMETHAAIINAREGEYFVAAYNQNMEVIIAPAHADEQMCRQALLTIGMPHIINADSKSLGLAKTLTPHSGLMEGIVPEYWAEWVNRSMESGKYASIHTSEPFYMKDVFIRK